MLGVRQPFSIKLSLNNPCSQKWEEMSDGHNGKFCNHCAKTVVDFTKMTDASLIRYVQQNGLGCGRLRVDQLERIIASPPKPAPNWWGSMMLSIGLIIALPKDASAKPEKTFGISMEQLDRETPQLRKYLSPAPVNKLTEQFSNLETIKISPPYILGGMGSTQADVRKVFAVASTTSRRDTVLARRLKRISASYNIKKISLKRFFNFGKAPLDYGLHVDESIALKNTASLK